MSKPHLKAPRSMNLETRYWHGNEDAENYIGNDTVSVKLKNDILLSNDTC